MILDIIIPLSLSAMQADLIKYYLIPFDENGTERPKPHGTLRNDTVKSALGNRSYTDVFIISHVWQGDATDALGQSSRWVPQMPSMARTSPPLGAETQTFSL
jgi:hypothetical protein